MTNARIKVNGEWKKVSSIKVKVNGKWENITSAYRKMSGEWKKFFEVVRAKVLSYYGVATPLSVARYGLAATTVGDYAIFGGGYPVINTLHVYNSSLVKNETPSLSIVRRYLAATTVGDYALFGGGYDTGGNTVDAYDTSLTRTTATPLSVARHRLAATTVGDYALFGGGATERVGGTEWYLNGHTYRTKNYYNTTDTVDAYNTSLTRTTPTPLSRARMGLAATTVGDYALFGGGQYTVSEHKYRDFEANAWKWESGSNPNTGIVDAYNTSLVRTTVSSIYGRSGVKTAKVGGYALFLGNGTTAEVYDTSLVKTTITLQVSRTYFATTEIGDFTIIAGGDSKIVEVYDTSLVKTNLPDWEKNRNDLAATTVGDYALFGGGYDGEYSTIVDVYQYK